MYHGMYVLQLHYVSVLINDSMFRFLKDPLFLDLIGTCHSEELKPTILHSRHLRVYRQNLLRGLTCYPPDILSAMLAEDKLQLDESGSLLLNEVCPYNNEPRRFPTPHVTVHPSELHFDPGLASQSVSITNRTKGKLSLLWTPSADSPFSVTPLNCDLSPLKSTAFRVTYAPKQHNTFHAAQLECFALYKVKLDSEECPAVRVQPSSGLVSPGSHQILTLRSTPSEDHPPSFPLTLHFNANPRHTQV
uniref:Uncharacterized protein n=1 Tax=Electrophorus electricus TaxID=8005 RepID=A0A4W4GPK4_ELEEL